jgi:hypothetical protein
MSQHLLQMAPCTDLVAKKMFGRAHHALLAHHTDG